MSEYEINPMKKKQPYAKVSVSKGKIRIRCPKYKFTTLLDAQAGADLVMAINKACRESGYAYIPNLGEQE